MAGGRSKPPITVADVRRAVVRQSDRAKCWGCRVRPAVVGAKLPHAAIFAVWSRYGISLIGVCPVCFVCALLATDRALAARVREEAGDPEMKAAQRWIEFRRALSQIRAPHTGEGKGAKP